MQPPVIKTLCRKFGSKFSFKCAKPFELKSVFLTHVILDLRPQTPGFGRMTQCLKISLYSTFHVKLQGCSDVSRTERWPWADLPGSPECGWLQAVSASVLSIPASVGTASSPEKNFHIRASLNLLSVLLRESSEDASRNTLFPELLRKSMRCFTSC